MNNQIYITTPGRWYDMRCGECGQDHDGNTCPYALLRRAERYVRDGPPASCKAIDWELESLRARWAIEDLERAG